MKRRIPFTQDGPIVYFVEIGKFIKIGFTTNLKTRMSAFLNSAPSVELLLTIPGGRDLERDIHNILVDRRVAREMYHHNDDRIRGFIRQYELNGLQPALDYLDETTPEEREARKAASRINYVEIRRRTKAEKNAYFSSLVAQRKERLGW